MRRPALPRPRPQGPSTTLGGSGDGLRLPPTWTSGLAAASASLDALHPPTAPADADGTGAPNGLLADGGSAAAALAQAKAHGADGTGGAAAAAADAKARQDGAAALAGPRTRRRSNSAAAGTVAADTAAAAAPAAPASSGLAAEPPPAAALPSGVYALAAMPVSQLLRPEVLLAAPEAAPQLALRLGLDETHQLAAYKSAQILQSMLCMARATPAIVCELLAEGQQAGADGGAAAAGWAGAGGEAARAVGEAGLEVGVPQEERRQQEGARGRRAAARSGAATPQVRLQGLPLCVVLAALFRRCRRRYWAAGGTHRWAMVACAPHGRRRRRGLSCCPLRATLGSAASLADTARARMSFPLRPAGGVGHWRRRRDGQRPWQPLSRRHAQHGRPALPRRARRRRKPPPCAPGLGHARPARAASGGRGGGAGQRRGGREPRGRGGGGGRRIARRHGGAAAGNGGAAAAHDERGWGAGRGGGGAAHAQRRGGGGGAERRRREREHVRRRRRRAGRGPAEQQQPQRRRQGNAAGQRQLPLCRCVAPRTQTTAVSY